MKDQRRVLSISLDPDIRETRHRVLQQAGFSVRSAANLELATELLRREHFDVLVLGHNANLNSSAKELRKLSAAPILVTVNGAEISSEGADRIVDAFQPADLITSIREVLAEAAARNTLRQAIDQLKIETGKLEKAS